MDNLELFVCICESLEHLVGFYYDEEDNQLSMQVHIIPERNIFNRIKLAVKYILDKRSRYGEFEEFILKDSDVEKLKIVLEKIKHNEKFR